MENEMIPIFGREGSDPEEGPTRSLTLLSDYLYGHGEVPASTLHSRLNAFLQGLRTVFDSLPDDVGGLQLGSVTVTAEISAKGQVSLLGIGGDVTGKGGITFTFARKHAG